MKNGLVFLSTLLFTFSAVKAQDTLYTISNYNTPGIRQIVNIDPNTGAGASVNASYATGDNTTLSAAMALAGNGYLYYIPYVPNEINNQGAFEIYSIAAYPTISVNTPPSSQEVYSGDINGAATTTAVFRTMSAAPDGWIYLTFSDENGTISLARFQPGTDPLTGQGTVTSLQTLGTITLNGNTPGSNLRNGDIAFDGSGNLYALINEDQANGNAVIYFAPASAISATSSGTTNLVTKYQVVKSGGGNFSEYVVGLAVSSTGNFYIAVQDDHDPSQGGVYLLTRNASDNQLVISNSPISNDNPRYIADLAASYFPNTTILPVVYGPIFAKIVDRSLVLNWSTLSEINNTRFEIEVSKDGQHFTNIGTVDTKAVDGNSDKTISYSFIKTIDVPMAAMGISLLSLAVILLFLNRKNRLLLSVMMVMGIGLTFASCSKNGDQVDVSGEGKLFVRIVQVDKDGTRSVTDAITAYRAD
ncbi:NHL repeat-containing protein [Niabella aquatica]